MKGTPGTMQYVSPAGGTPAIGQALWQNPSTRSLKSTYRDRANMKGGDSNGTAKDVLLVGTARILGRGRSMQTTVIGKDFVKKVELALSMMTRVENR